MVDFRRWITALAVLALFAGLAAAQVGGSGQTQLTCSTNVTATPQLRAEGYTEQTGDITITCTGGSFVTPGNIIPAVNITIFLNTAVTSRLLPLGSSGQNAQVSEALLLIDEPGSSVNAVVPNFGPQAAQTLCPTPLSGCTEYSTNVGGTAVATNTQLNNATTGTGPITGATAGYNVFQGLVNGNSVTWFGIPVLPPVSTGTSRVFRFTNIRANATTLSGGSAAGATPVVASIATSNSSTLPITQPTPTVGFVQSGLSTSATGSTALQQCLTTTKGYVNTLTFSENFGTAFKTRVQPMSAAKYAGQSYPLVSGQQNIPGGIYNSESNFIYPGDANTHLSTAAGLADFGTRLKATFNNIPTGMRLFVSVNNVLNGTTNGVTPPANPGDNSTGSFAQLVISETTADGNASGGFFPSVGSSTTAGASGAVPLAELAITAGSATAVWEVLNTNPNAQENVKFSVFTTYISNVAQNSPPAGTATVNMSFAPTPPVFTASSGAAASSSLTVPRFIADPNAAKNIFGVNICRTILLYPYITNQAGFDTGIAIANTTTDPFGTGPQAGSCALNWYSGASSPAATNTGNIASGTVYTTLASVTVPGFQGYMIAVCQFQYAHGFAFISDLGARNLAMGYLALVIPDPSSVGGRNADPLSTAVGGSGENIAH